MKKSIKDYPKRRGRPATGNAPLVGVRMTENLQENVRSWAEQQADQPALATAIRRLVEIGLTLNPRKSSPPREPGYGPKAAKAKELAAKAIDAMSDDLASATEQATRKRRLLKGPEEFREARVDRPKKK